MTPNQLREALARYTPTDAPPIPGRTNSRRAGVLVPVRFEAHPNARTPDQTRDRMQGDSATLEPVVILTLRPATMRRHAGEVSFPGGKPDPDDVNLEATAVREAREELGITRAEVIGPLSTVPLYNSDFRLVPYVAIIPAEDVLIPQPSEVAKVLYLPMREVLERPYLDGIPWRWNGEVVHSPVFELEGHLLYGGTAHTVLELLQIVAPLMEKTIPPWKSGRYTWESIIAQMISSEDVPG